MRKHIQLLDKLYFNQPIKNKFIILVSIILCIAFSATVAGLQYAFYSYDEQLYLKSSQVLSTSSNTIENELKKMESISYSIASDPLIQEYLYTLEEEKTEYELYRISTEIKDKILSFTNSEKFIQAIHIIDSKGKEHVTGKRNNALPEELKQNIITQGNEAAGKNTWMDRVLNERILLSVREIRRYEDFSFAHLGTVVIKVDVDRLVRSLIEGSRSLEGYYIIINNRNEVIYPEETDEMIDQLVYKDSPEKDYRIQTLQGKKYFNVYMHSDYSSWTYINIIPFDEIFKNINILKVTIFGLFLTIFFIALVVGIKFANGITTPIENLAKSIQHLHKGDFRLAKRETFNLEKVHNDEVGQLYNNFLAMIQQIDELIHANYSKQMLIKETEFKALQAQINPHFLYNTLESVNWLAKMSGQKQISHMVESLGFLLRSSMNIKESLISVDNELKIVENYIIIQSYRFEERLDFHLQVDHSLLNQQIPKFTLQPLVENAIHYALEAMITPCTISITSIQEQSLFRLIVEDNGSGMNQELLEKVRKYQVKTRGQGIGLRNIDERIKIIFGEQYGISIDSEENVGTKVTVTLPYERGG